MIDFSGVYTALITPFDQENNVDFQKLEELIDFQINKGVTGIVFGGTTGEGMLINDLYSFYNKVIELVKKRVKVFLTIFDFNKTTVTDLISELNKLDFDGYLINTPYYLNTNQEGIKNYYEYFDSIVNKSFIIYYNPLRSNQYITLNTWKSLLNLKWFIGVKDASMNLTYNNNLMDLMKNHFYFTGNDSLYYLHLTYGSSGIISSLSNALPDVFVKMYFLYKNKEYDIVAKMFSKYTKLINVINLEPNPIGLKFFMNHLGFNVGNPLFPLELFSKNSQIKLKSVYKELQNENINYW